MGAGAGAGAIWPGVIGMTSDKHHLTIIRIQYLLMVYVSLILTFRDTYQYKVYISI